MKYLFFSFIFIRIITSTVHGQNTESDSLKYLLKNVSHDTNGVKLLLNASNKISFFNPDSGIIMAEKALDLARDIHFKKGEVNALNTDGEAFHFLGDYPKALKIQFDALQINKDMKDSAGEAGSLGLIGILYIELGEYRQALQYLIPAIKIYQQLPGEFEGSFELSNIADAYYSLNIPDSALYYQRKGYELFSDRLARPHLKSFILTHMGNIYAETGKNDSALKFYHASILNSRLLNDKLNMAMAQNKVANLYESIHQYDSAFYYAQKALSNARSMPSKLFVLHASDLLARLYKESRNPDSAFYYLNVATAMRDSLYGPEKFRQLQLLMLEEQQKQETIRRQQEDFRNKIKYTALLSGLGIFLLLAFILYRNNKQKQKANVLLQHQKEKVESTLSELKSTQSQLIQSEKMASLGELTAGIAHEIQNPLNFVNNFSEVNTELIEEMEQEIDNGNTAEVKGIANDVKENNLKIIHHGKRADAIVKGMLQHSRVSTGQKEPTDINALADEYLRLAYHGLRAKDQSFNATLKTDYDANLSSVGGNINIIPQDIGRVLLNLYNNAFYTVTEKKKQQGEGYEPTVSVSTKKLNGKIEIHVKDNGNGIPQKALDKIFQPFFTTKPTGQGTGLGLSLSYDIIKSHGGEIKVETKEGEGSEFIIILNS